MLKRGLTNLGLPPALGGKVHFKTFLQIPPENQENKNITDPVTGFQPNQDYNCGQLFAKLPLIGVHEVKLGPENLLIGKQLAFGFTCFCRVWVLLLFDLPLSPSALELCAHCSVADSTWLAWRKAQF